MSAVQKLERSLFVQSRDREYFEANELATMTGQPVHRFADVIVKEVVDNGLDAAEEAGVVPKIVVQVWRRHHDLILSIKDNGGGISPEAVEGILDFRTRTSNKAAYRSTTRGQQGNAWKTIIGTPYALGSRQPLVIEAQGKKHVIRPHIDPAGHARIDRAVQDITDHGGTNCKLSIPLSACRELDLGHWMRGYALFNPHAFIKFRDVSLASKLANSDGPERARTARFYKSTVRFPEEWKKFLPTDLIPIHWYDQPSLGKLIFNHVANSHQGGPELTLREFLCRFPGFKSTLRESRTGSVCAQLPDVKHLSDFESRENLIQVLLDAMLVEAGKPPKPHILGLIGEEHFRSRFEQWFGVKQDGDGKQRFWYSKVCLEIDRIPYVFEVAVAQTHRPGRFFHGINFSPCYEDPFQGNSLSSNEVFGYGVSGYLSNAHAYKEANSYYTTLPFNSAVAVHLVSPALQFLDKGKTTLDVPRKLAEAAGEALWEASKVLYREGEKRKKDAARQQRADEKRDKIKDDLDVPLTKVMPLATPSALEHATGDGAYRVSTHMLYYAARKEFQKHTSRELESQYYEQKLLPPYIRRHPGMEKQLYREARGTLYEPHTGIEVQLGTREVEEYHFPSWRYKSILFVEKQGLYPILKEAKLGERYDMAIIAGEGFANEACRVLFQNAEKGDYQIFTVHDADPYGYNISRTCREETERMPGYHVDVIDIGLTLQDALDLELAVEWAKRKKALPKGLKLTPLEEEYFTGEQVSKKQWKYRRVELNAFTAPGLVAYIEQGLAKHWQGKVIPPVEKLTGLTKNLHESILDDVIRSEVSRILSTEDIIEAAANSCRELIALENAETWIKDAFGADPTIAWDAALRRKIHLLLEEKKRHLEDAVRDSCKQILG
jgi:hypothetical protein